jgi:hypothetical protein
MNENITVAVFYTKTCTLDNYLRQEYLKVKPQPTRSFICISILYQCEIKRLNCAGREMSTKLLCSK